MKKILVASPIRQSNKILNEFLKSLDELDKENLEVHYFFVDDNTDEKSSMLLDQFKTKQNNVILKSSKDYIIENPDTAYLFSSVGDHMWKEDLIKKVTLFKDDMINFARKEKFDYIFFIDSDIVLNKNTLQHLISLKLDIVSNVFWTQWFVGSRQMEPQVWLQDDHKNFIQNWDHPLTKEEQEQSRADFYSKLKIPGTYKVGGLGACTLISKKAIDAGVSFKKIDNLSFWGEDRHFCIRAGALGFDLFVDTTYPAYHIYRETYLDRVEEFKKEGFKLNDMCFGDEQNKKSLSQKIKFFFYRLKQKLKALKSRLKYKIKKLKKKLFKPFRRISKTNRVVLSMVVKNEENRYLRQILKHILPAVDAVMILDDASTDWTVDICKEILKDKEHKIIVNEKSMFHNEWKLRKKQWKETLKMKPDWILCLDADEMFEDAFFEKLPYLLKENSVDVYNFRLFDMWDSPDKYRSDRFWNAHKRYCTFLIRYQKHFHYRFRHTAQHCGRFPANIRFMNCLNSDLRIKHFGWMKKEDRVAKYERYMKLDPEGKFGNLEQYKSIVDENPHLEQF